MWGELGAARRLRAGPAGSRRFRVSLARQGRDRMCRRRVRRQPRLSLPFFCESRRFCSNEDSERSAQGLPRSEEHTSELQSHLNLVCRLLLEKKKKDKFFILRWLVTSAEQNAFRQHNR